MTFALYIVLVIGLLIGGLNILPNASDLPPTIIASISTVIGYVKAFNFILPVGETILAVTIILIYEFFMWGWHATVGIIKFFRGSSAGE